MKMFMGGGGQQQQQSSGGNMQSKLIGMAFAEAVKVRFLPVPPRLRAET